MTGAAAIDSAHLDPVRGPPLEDDIVAWEFIQDRKTLAFEADLMALKWFDYRHMTPLQATRLYIQAYTDAYSRFVREVQDIELARVISPTNIDSIFRKLALGSGPKFTNGKSQLKSAWHGRQVADLLGVPYDVYVNKAMELRLRYWNRAQLPQMRHLYGEMIIDRMPGEWFELQGASLYLSDHPAYLVQNYCGTQAQNDYHEWLFRQAEMRPDKPAIMARFINDDLISYEKVRARTTVDDFQRVHQFLH